MKYSRIYKGTMKEVLNMMKDDMLRNYNKAVKELMSNDKNATYDEILIDNNYDLIESYKELKECIVNVLQDLNPKDDDYKFYKEILETL